MPTTTTTRRVVAVGAAVAAGAAFVSPARAATIATHEGDGSCVIRVVGQEGSGAFVTGEPVCFGTLAEALESVGASGPVARAVRSDRELATLAAASGSGTIAVHFDGANRTGASIVVTGADCGGGYLNLSTDWVNRISSTLNSCSNTRFFDGYDKSGTQEGTNLGTVNLGPLNNAANSVLYGT